MNLENTETADLATASIVSDETIEAQEESHSEFAPEEPQDQPERKKKISNRIQTLVYENRQKEKQLLMEQKRNAELQAQLLSIENEKLKSQLKEAFIDGDSDKIVDLQDRLAENKAKSTVISNTSNPENSPVTGEEVRTYFSDKFPWYQVNTQMTMEAEKLDTQFRNDPDWQDASWKSRLSAVGKMIEAKFSNGRVSPATDGVKSGAATPKALYTQSEWAAFLRMNPGAKTKEAQDELRARLNKIKKTTPSMEVESW